MYSMVRFFRNNVWISLPEWFDTRSLGRNSFQLFQVDLNDLTIFDIFDGIFILL